MLLALNQSSSSDEDDVFPPPPPEDLLEEVMHQCAPITYDEDEEEDVEKNGKCKANIIHMLGAGAST